MWQEMGFGWMGMFELDEKVLNVAGHTDAMPAICIVPFDVNGHVELDPMDFFDNITELVEVF